MALFSFVSSGRAVEYERAGAAKRRRERRLRAMLRHERQTVAMELAAALHHSRDGGRVTYHGLRAPKTASSGGRRPGVLKEPEPPNVVEQVLLHTVDQIVLAVPLVPLLDDPVPQTVDTVLEFFRSLDLPVDEQVIAVPKISFDRVSQRLVERRLPQIVEQLVEVPTVLTPTRIALQIAEQIVGIPVPRGRGEQRLQGFSPGQGSTMVSSAELISERTVEQIVDFRGGGLQGFSPGQGTTAFSSAERLSERTAEQSVDIPGGGLQGFSPGQVSSPFSSAKRLSERTAEHIVDVPGGGLHAGFLPGSSSTAGIPPQPLPDPWWESLTPAMQAEIEEATAQERREQRSKRTRKKKRKKKAPRSSSYSSCARARRRQRQWHVSGFSGDASSSCCVPFVAARPRCSASWPV